jgi:hypothetical protein
MWRRVAVVAAAILANATLYMALLAWTLIPLRTASAWSREPIATLHVDVLVGSFALPVGPYVTVAVLLGTLSTAVFLASVVVDADYADRFSSALLSEPASRGLALTGMYLALVKRSARPPTRGRTSRDK